MDTSRAAHPTDLAGPILYASVTSLKKKNKKKNCDSSYKNNEKDYFLSYDVAVIQWITSCHKKRMTTRYITLGYWRVTS